MIEEVVKNITEEVKDNTTEDNNIYTNTDNTKPAEKSRIELYNESLTPEERKARASAAGKKSAEMYRKRKTITEMLQNMLYAAPSPEFRKMYEEKTGSRCPEGVTLYELLGASMMAEALQNGNTRAFLAVRDTAGDQPTQKQEINTSVMTEKDIELLHNIEKRLSK